MCLFLFKASKTVDIRSDQDLGDNSAKLLQVPYKSADLITSGLTNYQHINTVYKQCYWRWLIYEDYVLQDSIL